MKKILLIILLLLLCKVINGQYYFNSAEIQPEPLNLGLPNTLYLTVQPTDLGVGVRYDRVLFNKFYGYTSLTYGNYHMKDGSYIKDHVKFALGAVITSRYFYPEAFMTVGASYHYYGEHYFTGGYTDNNTLIPVSCEVGIGTKLGKMTAAFRMDIPKWESSLDFGFNF